MNRNIYILCLFGMFIEEVDDKDILYFYYTDLSEEKENMIHYLYL